MSIMVFEEGGRRRRREADYATFNDPGATYTKGLTLGDFSHVDFGRLEASVAAEQLHHGKYGVLAEAYTELVDAGIYHPGTRFFATPHMLLARMPRLDTSVEVPRPVIDMTVSSLQEMLELEAVHKDTGAARNYGSDGSQFYYLDLEVFPNQSSPRRELAESIAPLADILRGVDSGHVDRERARESLFSLIEPGPDTQRSGLRQQPAPLTFVERHAIFNHLFDAADDERALLYGSGYVDKDLARRRKGVADEFERGLIKTLYPGVLR